MQSNVFFQSSAGNLAVVQGFLFFQRGTFVLSRLTLEGNNSFEKENLT